MESKKKRRRRKSCWHLARTRITKVRRNGKGRLVCFLLFLFALATAPIFPARWLPRLDPEMSRSPRRKQPDPDTEVDWPISDCERGYSTKPRPRRRSSSRRYATPPTMARLMRDLRRPAARADATAALLARIPDSDVRQWALAQIHAGEINRLSIWVRPHIPESAILTAWQRETEVEAEERDRDRDNNIPIEALTAAINAVVNKHVSHSPKNG